MITIVVVGLTLGVLAGIPRPDPVALCVETAVAEWQAASEKDPAITERHVRERAYLWCQED